MSESKESSESGQGLSQWDLEIPDKVKEEDLPYTLRENVSESEWQEATMNSSQSTALKFLWYDKEKKRILVTELPQGVHGVATIAVQEVIKTSSEEADVEPHQRLEYVGTIRSATTGRVPDLAFKPSKVSSREEESEQRDPTLVVEVSVHRTEKEMEDKRKVWLGPKSSVQLVLQVDVKGHGDDDSKKWALKASLYKASKDRDGEPELISGPVEAGEIRYDGKEIKEKTEPGDPIIKMPMELLFWKAEVPKIPTDPYWHVNFNDVWKRFRFNLFF